MVSAQPPTQRRRKPHALRCRIWGVWRGGENKTKEMRLGPKEDPSPPRPMGTEASLPPGLGEIDPNPAIGATAVRLGFLPVVLLFSPCFRHARLFCPSCFSATRCFCCFGEDSGTCKVGTEVRPKVVPGKKGPAKFWKQARACTRGLSPRSFTPTWTCMVCLKIGDP